ncbi:MAG: hypothetical protein N3F67_00235 [Acidilobaceae archaeon]|nr:hypothetical protein [Acidilobaceae archaeon]
MKGLRRLLAALVLALLLLPLAGTLVEVRAQAVALEVYARVVTPGSPIVFVLDREAVTNPSLAGPVLYFFLSKRPEATISPDDILIQRLILPEDAVDARFVAGLLIIPADLPADFVGDVVLKASTITQPGGGITAVFSSLFRIVRDEAAVERALRFVHPVTKEPVRDLAFFNFTTHGIGAFKPHNRVSVIVNLSALGVAGNFAIRRDNVSGAVVMLRHPCLSRVLANVTVKVPIIFPVRIAPGSYLYSDFLEGLSYRYRAGGRVLEINGTFRGDFPLMCLRSRSIEGISVGFQDFNVSAVAVNGTRLLAAGSKKVIIDSGSVIGVTTDEVQVPRAIVSIGAPYKINMYPSVAYRFVDLGRGNFFDLESGRITPGDRVVIDYRNIRPGALDVSIFVRDEVFSRLLVNRTAVPAARPNGTISGHIPAAQYGGRIVVVSINATRAVDPVALPNLSPVAARARVLPAIQTFAFNNAGAIVPGNASALAVPGEIFVMRGVGFQFVRKPDIRVNATPVRELFYRDFANGSFIAVLQIPPSLVIRAGQPVIFNATVAAPFNSHSFSDRANYSDARVFVEPRVALASLTARGAVASLGLGAERFVFRADWEPLERRVVNILAYGMRPDLLRFNVSLFDGARSSPVVVERTGSGSLELINFPVPEVPRGNYRVNISDRAASFVSSARDEDRIRIVQTAAGRDAEGVFRKIVFLPAPMNMSVRGFGFPANADVFYDIPALGETRIRLSAGPAALPVGARTNALGSFEGWINFDRPDIRPGTYVVRVYTQVAGEEIAAEIRVVLLVPPPFRVDLVVESSQVSDAPVDLWAVAFYGSEIARPAQISSVIVRAFLRIGEAAPIVRTISLLNVTKDRAIYHALFNPVEAFGPAVKGRFVLLIAEASGRFVPLAPVDVAVDAEVLYVPPRSIGEEISAALRGNLSALDSLIRLVRSDIAALRSGLAANFSVVRSDIAAVRSDIAAVRALLITVDEKASAQLTALIAISDRTSDIISRLAALDARVASGIAVVRADISSLASLLRAVNASIRDVVVAEGAAVRASIVAGRDAIIGVVRANASALAELIRAVDRRVDASARALSDALAAFRSESLSRMDSIVAEVGRARTDIAAVGAGVTVVQSVLAEVRTIAATVNDRVVGVRSVVDSINAAMAGVATKSDLASARDAVASRVAAAESSINSRVDGVKRAVDDGVASIESRIASAQDALAVSSRNWGVINAVLVIIAIALLAYSIFVARRP